MKRKKTGKKYLIKLSDRYFGYDVDSDGDLYDEHFFKVYENAHRFNSRDEAQSCINRLWTDPSRVNVKIIEVMETK